VYLVLKKSRKFKDLEWILKIRTDYQNLVKIIFQLIIINDLNSTKNNNKIEYCEFRKQRYCRFIKNMPAEFNNRKFKPILDKGFRFSVVGSQL
jgi:hypothetical protein